MKAKIIKIGVALASVALITAACSSQQQPTGDQSQNNQPDNAPMQQAPDQNTPTPDMGQANPAPDTATASGSPRNASSTRGHMTNAPQGSTAFFGKISAVNGSTITISGRSRTSSSSTATIITVTGNTQFQGGSQSNLAVNALISGYGTANADQSINAQSIQINPSFSGGQGRQGGQGGHWNGSTSPATNQ